MCLKIEFTIVILNRVVNHDVLYIEMHFIDLSKQDMEQYNTLQSENKTKFFYGLSISFKRNTQCDYLIMVNKFHNLLKF
jgi:predicted AAA+ superfamily ATPase